MKPGIIFSYQLFRAFKNGRIESFVKAVLIRIYFLLKKGRAMEAGERIEVLEKWKQVHVDRHVELEEKVERLLAELAEIRQTSGRIKEIKIKDSGKGKDK